VLRAFDAAVEESETDGGEDAVAVGRRVREADEGA
jgi:hypothetical protein